MQKLKILIIGPQRSGKTIISDYLHTDDRRKPKIYRPTIGVRILEFQREIQIENEIEKINVELWDLSGDLKFESTWNVIQDNIDGCIMVANADGIIQREELEAWLNNFPRKMKITPSCCIGFANHPSGKINNKKIKILSIDFIHCCFEKRAETIDPSFNKLLQNIIINKKK